jgi:gliding motility associated protien GldN
MKKLILSLFAIAALSFYGNDAVAQFKKIQTNRPPAKTEPTQTGKKDAKTGTTAPTTTTTVTTAKKDTAILRPTKRFDTARQTGGNDYGAVVPTSRRNGYGYSKESVGDRKPLPYDHVREDDATYSQFVWREIDAREKMNLPFVYSAKDESGDQRFFSIILNAIKNDSVVAFSADGGDDRFTTPLTYDQVLSASTNTSSRLDTTYTPNINNEDVLDTVIIWKENLAAPKPDSIYKFRVKEQYLFDKESSRMMVRIIGIAPMAPNATLKGAKKGAGPTTYYPLFWIYYPDLRPTLSRSFAYNPKNVGGRMTWEEVFEGRFFSSYIIKSTLDNPGNKTLAQLIKDPLFQLLEGENIKEKLFNYEQDLWSY